MILFDSNNNKRHRSTVLRNITIVRATAITRTKASLDDASYVICDENLYVLTSM